MSQEERITIRLSPQAKVAANKIMELGGFPTIQEAIRRAIGDELFLQEQQANGWTVVLKKGSEYQELFWPKPA